MKFLTHIRNLANQTLWILAFGFFFATIAFFIVWNQQQRIWSDELKQEVLENTLILVGKLEGLEQELMGIVSLYNASEHVSRQDFAAYVNPLLEKHKFIQGFEWVPKVSHPLRQFYEAKIQTEGFTKYSFKELDSSKQLVRASKRKEYYPVFYQEPLSQDSTSQLGFDWASDPARLKDMNDSRDFGKPLATRIIPWMDGSNGEPVILIFAPFFESRTTPENIEDRRKSIRGFLLGIYLIQTMMDKLADQYLPRGMNLMIFEDDSTASENKLYGEPLSNPLLEDKSVINFSGRRWLLVWQGNEQFLGGPKTGYSFWVSGSVLGISIFVSIIFQMMASRTRQVENQVTLRTEELTRTNDQLTQEISARQQVENKLKIAKEEAELANRAKSAFLANMSHEIRTPMNAILGYAQILARQKNLNANQISNVENILNNGDHLLRIINDILHISKIEAGKLELNPEDFDLQELVRDLSAIIQPLCEEKHLKWQVEGLAEDPIYVHADEIKLKQVLINLLGNAVKFVDSGFISLIVTPMENHLYRFEVSDSGKGIPQKFQESIFDPFEQEPEGMQKGGTGLGLTIVKKIVDLMGGTLSLESAPEKGARFFFSLNLPPAQDNVLARKKWDVETCHLVQGFSVKALVADDNQHNRDVLWQILNDLGANVILAENGQEAVDQALAQKPDIVFMDMRMPVMNGIDAIQEIKRKLPGNAIKTVAITASVFEHQREVIVQSGCEDFISKPFRIERIINCLQKLLNVEFESTSPERQDDPGEPQSLDYSQIRLPKDLLERLKLAAKLHDITDFKVHLAELDRGEKDYQSLALEMKPLFARYDLDGILKILEKIHHE